MKKKLLLHILLMTFLSCQTISTNTIQEVGIGMNSMNSMPKIRDVKYRKTPPPPLPKYDIGVYNFYETVGGKVYFYSLNPDKHDKFPSDQSEFNFNYYLEQIDTARKIEVNRNSLEPLIDSISNFNNHHLVYFSIGILDSTSSNPLILAIITKLQITPFQNCWRIRFVDKNEN